MAGIVSLRGVRTALRFGLHHASGTLQLAMGFAGELAKSTSGVGIIVLEKLREDMARLQQEEDDATLAETRRRGPVVNARAAGGAN